MRGEGGTPRPDLKLCGVGLLTVGSQGIRNSGPINSL